MEQSVLHELEVDVLALLDIGNHIENEFAILLSSLPDAPFLSILLYAPNSPEHNVRLLNLVDSHGERFARHKLVERLDGSLHAQSEIVVVVCGKGETRQRDECIARTSLEPRNACENVALVTLTIVELVGCINERVIEIVVRNAVSHLIVKQLFES